MMSSINTVTLSLKWIFLTAGDLALLLILLFGLFQKRPPGGKVLIRMRKKTGESLLLIPSQISVHLSIIGTQGSEWFPLLFSFFV